MYRLSRKDKETGGITHSVEQETNVLSGEHTSDWNKWGPYDLVIVDITQEQSDKAQKDQDKIDALSRIKSADMAVVTTLPELILVVKDLVKIVKGD